MSCFYQFCISCFSGSLWWTGRPGVLLFMGSQRVRHDWANELNWTGKLRRMCPKKGNAKECSNYPTIGLISRASKVMLKLLQAKLQQYENRELPDVQAGFRRGRGTRDQIRNQHLLDHRKKAREFQKNIYFCFIDYIKAFECVDHTKPLKILRDGNTRPPDLPLEKSICRSGSNS